MAFVPVPGSPLHCNRIPARRLRPTRLYACNSVGSQASQYTTGMRIDQPACALLRRLRPKFVAAVLAGVCAGCPASLAAATIALHQDAATAAVGQRLFTHGGKRMLTGSLESCTYVYLEQPAVTFRERRLFLRARLAGRAGLKINGQCAGAGDAFFTTVSGQPYVSGETIALKNFRLDEGKAEYRGLLEPLLRQQIPLLLGVNLRGELMRLLQDNTSGFEVSLTQFKLIDVTALDGLLSVRFDFALRADKR